MYDCELNLLTNDSLSHKIFTGLYAIKSRAIS